MPFEATHILKHVKHKQTYSSAHLWEVRNQGWWQEESLTLMTNIFSFCLYTLEILNCKYHIYYNTGCISNLFVPSNRFSWHAVRCCKWQTWVWMASSMCQLQDVCGQPCGLYTPLQLACCVHQSKKKFFFGQYGGLVGVAGLSGWAVCDACGGVRCEEYLLTVTNIQWCISVCNDHMKAT